MIEFEGRNRLPKQINRKVTNIKLKKEKWLGNSKILRISDICN
jgi:hypothetical protein